MVRVSWGWKSRCPIHGTVGIATQRHSVFLPLETEGIDHAAGVAEHDLLARFVEAEADGRGGMEVAFVEQGKSKGGNYGSVGECPF